WTYYEAPYGYDATDYRARRIAVPVCACSLLCRGVPGCVCSLLRQRLWARTLGRERLKVGALADTRLDRRKSPSQRLACCRNLSWPAFDQFRQHDCAHEIV